MKKNYKFLAIFLIGLFISFNSFAAENSIAVLDMKLVMNGTKVAKEKQADLKKRSAKAQKRISEMEDSFKQQIEDLKRKKSILSKDKFLEEQNELRRVSREHQLEVQKINAEFAREYKRIQKEISDEVDAVVKDLAAKKGFKVVMAKNYLVYSADSIDISKEVLKIVDANLSKKNK